MRPLARGECSTVAKAAYITRSRLRDARTGTRHDHRRRAGDLVHAECIGWPGTPGQLANAMEQAESRRNARTARELIVALPRHLSPEGRIRLARSHALWLRKRYGVVCLLAVHEPQPAARGGEDTIERSNPHAHILFSTRSWDQETGSFGAKTRVLDDRTTGPAEILALRALWAHRATAALEREGRNERVDLRSIAERVRTGDLPEGTLPQTHLGPLRAERARQREARGQQHPLGSAVARNARIAANNDELRGAWLALRALYRERQKERRLARQRAAIEAGRQVRARAEAEAARRATRDREMERLQAATTLAEVEAALDAATQIDIPDRAAWLARWASRQAVPAEGTSPADGGGPAKDAPPEERTRTADAPSGPATAPDPAEAEWPIGWEGGEYDPRRSEPWVFEPHRPGEGIEELIKWPSSTRPPIVIWPPDEDEDEPVHWVRIEGDPKPGSPEAEAAARREARDEERREHERQVYAQWRAQVWPLVVLKARLQAKQDPLADPRYDGMSPAEQERVQEVLVYHPDLDPLAAALGARDASGPVLDLDAPGPIRTARRASRPAIRRPARGGRERELGD